MKTTLLALILSSSLLTQAQNTPLLSAQTSTNSKITENYPHTPLLTHDIQGHWQFRATGTTAWMPATVPGTVHTDLLANKKIPDPFYRDNEPKLQWIEKKDWEYITTFQVSADILSRNHVELVFDGLDTYADIFLNEHQILSANNMFQTWTVDAKKWLKPTGNKLRILFHSAQNRVRAMAQADMPLILPDSARVYARKAQYHFGWDWGPKFTTAGIWRPIHIQGWNNWKLNNVQVTTEQLTNNTAFCKATCTITADHPATLQLMLLNKPDNKSKKEWTLYPPLSGLHPTQKESTIQNKEETIIQNLSLSITPGTHTYQISYPVATPRLWWSNGLGQPSMYNLLLWFQNQQNKEICNSTTAYGIRTIRVVQRPDSVGKSFYIELNGRPVFMKGADYIPQSPFLPSVTHKDTYTLIQAAKNAHMNMLRAWGGGVFESDDFYNQCDQNGILVWQDLLFACAMYPGDTEFMNSVRTELEQNVTRLRNHPSIALWCGNNENKEGWFNWGWQEMYNVHGADSAKVYQWYQQLFDQLIPDVLHQYDPQRFYWPTSPSYGWGHPESFTQGDSHYWGVWHGGKDGLDVEVFEEKTGRFVSEYGLESFPSWNTMQKFTLPADRDTASAVMKVHQKNGPGYYKLGSYIHRYFHEPKTFENLAYVSQVMQQYGIGKSIEIHRRKMPYCMGTLYWQLNDCWPVVSWSSIDGSGNWKALQYQVRENYKPQLLTVYEHDQAHDIYIVSDDTTNLNATLQYTILDFNGHTLQPLQQRPVTVIANSSRPYATLTNNQLQGIDTARAVLVLQLQQNGKTLATRYHYFARPRNLQLPHVTVTVKATGQYATYDVSAPTLAKNVQLTVNRKAIHFSDNYFDLLPGEHRTVTTNKPIKTTDIQIKTLADTY